METGKSTLNLLFYRKNFEKMNDRSNQILEPQEYMDIIQKKLNQKSMLEFSLIKYEILPLGESNGYLGQYFCLKASVARPEFPTDRRYIKFFIKIRPPKGTKQYDIVCNSGMFNREVRLYTKLFPEILDQSDTEYIPTCYLGLENYILVLDDIVSKGFRIFKNKSETLDFDHCKVVLKTLGMFHAKSIIFEEKKKKNLLDFCREKKIVIRSYDGPPPSVFTTGVKCALCVLEFLSEFDPLTRDKCMALVNEIQAKLHKMLVPSTKNRNVQLHGDLWTNNLMFKYSEDDKPIQCCFIDFQNTRYAPPAYDIWLFLYYSTTREMRSAHCEKLFKIYYDSVEKSLKEIDIDIKEIFPWSEFIASIAEFKIFGLLRAIIALPIVLSELETKSQGSMTTSQVWANVSDETSLFYSKQLRENEQFRSRMLDIFLELHDYV